MLNRVLFIVLVCLAPMSLSAEEYVITEDELLQLEKILENYEKYTEELWIVWAEAKQLLQDSTERMQSLEESWTAYEQENEAIIATLEDKLRTRTVVGVAALGFLGISFALLVIFG